MTTSNNPGRWKGQAFWSGMANIDTGEITRVFQYEIAEEADFNLSFMLTGDLFGGWTGEDLAYFYINDGVLQGETANDEAISEDLRQRILAQVDIRQPEAV